MVATRTQLHLARWAVLCILLTNAAAQKCTKRCPKITSPVCGSDGKTYKNQCKLENRQCSNPRLRLMRFGECRACKRRCSDTYEPVCGSDGVTYDNLCYLDNSACKNPMVSMQAHGECPKEVILVDFAVDLVATGVTKGPSDVTFEMSVTSAPGSQSISGRGLWKLGIYGCHYDDGYCDKIGHLPQILSEEQASTPLTGGEQMVVTDITAYFDVSIIGCDDLPYICAVFGKGDNPRPDFTLTMGVFDTAISCFRLPCKQQPVTDPPYQTPPCRYECPASGHVICGSDGQTYDTECALDNERRCGEDPESYLLTRKHYGPCRAGVIIDAMFWSAQAKETSSGETAVTVEVLIMSNDTGEGISGRNLWRLGLFGAKFADGSGPRLGYVQQLLDDALASSTLGAGKAMVLNAEGEFDVTAVGCSRYKFLCLEFTKGDSPQPQFPFHGNYGPEESSVFMACQQVPCTSEPEPEVPDDGRLRVYIGQLGWGLRAKGLRPDGTYDVILNVKAKILPNSDYVTGSNLLRVGLFGSPNQNGTGPRLGYQRQTLVRNQDISPTLAPDSNLVFEDVATQFPVTSLGCGEYGFLCLELVKGDEANPDFILISENTDTGSVPNSVILCKEIPCRPPPGGGGGGQKLGRLTSLRWRLSVNSFNSPRPSDLTIDVIGKKHAQSHVITGDGLWRVGLYASDDSDPLGPKYRYQQQILSTQQQSTPLGPDRDLEISGISVRFNVDGLGCGQLNYICLEFTKGNSPLPDFLMPLPQEDNDGVTRRIASCKPWPCQDTGGGGTGGHGGGTGGHGGGTGGHGGNTGGHGGGTGGHGGSTGGPGGGTGGHGGGTGGHGGGTGGHGGGTGGHGGGTGGHGGGTGGHGGGTGGHGGGPGGHGGGTGGHGGVSPPEPGPDAPFVAFQRMRWSRYQTSPVNPDGPTDVNIVLTLTPHHLSSTLEGYNLWKVGLFGSDVSNNTGVRFDEREDILSARDRSKPVVPGEDLVFNITTPFELREVGCGSYPYLCVEFGKDKYSWPLYRLAMGERDTVVSCQLVPCNPSTGHGGGSTGHGGGGTSGGHGGGAMIDPRLPTASFHNISWTAIAGETRPGVPTELRLHVVVFPKSYTDTIAGHRLWRIGLFGNTYKEGTGADRIGYVSQVLPPKQARRPLSADSPLEFNVNTRFLLHNFGCDLHRYLCVEFAQHEDPDPPFNFPIEGGAHISCRPYLCQDTPQPEPQGNQPTARINTMSWRMQPPKINHEGLTNIRLFVDVTPDPHTDVINGQHLWRVGIYGSKRRTGGDAFGQRLDYDPQLLQVHDARRTLAPTRPLNFDVYTKFNMKELGCGPYKYFCVEFAKDHLANPDFELVLASGDVSVSCERFACNPGGDGTDHTGGQPDQGPTKIVGITRVDWQVLAPTIYADGQSDLHILVEVTPHPSSDTIIGQEGSGFWRVGLFANRYEDGSHRQRYNYDRQILSQEDRDQSLIPPNPLNFDINVPFDLQRANCDSEFAYLCLEIAKGDSAWPDFNLPLPDNDLAVVTCQGAPCRPIRVPDGHGEGTGHGHLPVVTVTSVNMAGASIQPDVLNQLTLDAVVYLAPGGPAIRGTSLWRLEMWASATEDGGGPRVSHVDQALSQQYIDRNLVPPEPLFFSQVPFDLDMRNHECGDITHICAAFSKLDSSDPPFELETSPDASILTVCRPVDCHEPREPQIAVTGLSLFYSVDTTVYAKRPNRLILGVRINYDEPDSVGFEGTDLWGLKMWLSPKSNGKGKKVAAVKQALNAQQAALPLVVGRELQFEDINFSANLFGKRCNDARYICATLYKNKQPSVSYVLIARPNAKTLTKCLPVNCA